MMRSVQRAHTVVPALLLAVLATATGCKKKDSGGGAQGPDSASGTAAGAGGGNLIKNADFSDGTSLPWTSSFTQPAVGEAQVKDGALCLRIDNVGANPWDAQVRHREMTIQKGHSYSVSFKVWADKPTKMRAKVGMSGPPYGEYWTGNATLTTTPQTIRGQFTMNGQDDPTAEFAFHLGGNMAAGVQLPLTVCIDDVQLTDPQFTAQAREAQKQLPAVRVNQVGYFPGAEKIATLVNPSSSPLEWQLMQNGAAVQKGQTKPIGLDADSGDQVHVIDFTQAKKPGKGYVLQVGDAQSPPFEIENDLYSKMKYDALNYFYQNRSGIEIKMPYAKQEKWTRPAGHLSDKSVPCAKDAGCSYKLDVSGGWYDAGDHGKYVVNGGISVWTMMNQYERFSAFGSAAPFGDGKLNIPESKNGVPDILDEARWQMEFMLKMQVPDGQPKAGMVHHKIHDDNWTALGIRPDEAEKKMTRSLRPVSTAATLNLAATAAQASRLFKSYDAAFSKKLLTAAEKAWQAAKKNPNVLAPATDSTGGGPYDDKNVQDDFFWAAAELYATTKNPAYKSELTGSKYWTKMTDGAGGSPASMNWADTDALGTISLSIVPGALPAAEQSAQRQKIVSAADAYLKLIDAQGYRMPFKADPSGKYPWGSNSFILNNMMILALASDFTKKDQYLEGVVLGMDYLLGRNSLSQSYVTGWGSNPLVNPHHRFWSKQADARFPEAPPGAISGGPNSGLQDPYVKAAGLTGCQPQKCFVDNIEAWSANEITINWNAPFAWLSAYLDEVGPKAKAK
jgi:endoglucanase